MELPLFFVVEMAHHTLITFGPILYMYWLHFFFLMKIGYFLIERGMPTDDNKVRSDIIISLIRYTPT
jgi:hypothetical protein